VIYLLDTDICIYWLKGVPAVLERVKTVGVSQIAISTITVAELYFGAYNSAKIEENLARAEDFARQISIAPLDDLVLKAFGRIKADLRKQGQPLADFDLLIAGTVLANEFVLVTNNTQHYERIANLKLENWSA
jgi:tRNA(fMet)-specific endonuclease VapC